MDPDDGPCHLAAQVYACGCRETWMTYKPMEEPIRTVNVPCPAECDTCNANGLCAVRREMVNYSPSNFADITPVRRTNYRKMAL